MSTLPRVLVVVASRHGSTTEIARAVAARLIAPTGNASTALSAVVVPASQRPDPSPFDAVVLGSAVYTGRWLEDAREYASHHATALRARQVWLFSSGPIGQPPFPPDEPYDAAPLAAITGAREHRVFPGRLDPGLLSFGERAMVTAMRAPVGDFRDWAAVTAWAGDIAATLVAPGVPVADGGPRTEEPGAQPVHHI
jgi:menaquinone-dependent protoporphyrinogen oxidase